MHYRPNNIVVLIAGPVPSAGCTSSVQGKPKNIWGGVCVRVWKHCVMCTSTRKWTCDVDEYGSHRYGEMSVRVGIHGTCERVMWTSMCKNGRTTFKCEVHEYM